MLRQKVAFRRSQNTCSPDTTEFKNQEQQQQQLGISKMF